MNVALTGRSTRNPEITKKTQRLTEEQEQAISLKCFQVKAHLVTDEATACSFIYHFSELETRFTSVIVARRYP